MNMELFLATQLLEAGWAINSMKTEAEAAAQLDEEAMLEALGEISRQGLEADMAIRAALASREAPAPAPVPSLALRVAADALENGVVAMGSDGEWVSVRRHVRDAAVAAMRAAALAPLQAHSKE